MEETAQKREEKDEDMQQQRHQIETRGRMEVGEGVTEE